MKVLIKGGQGEIVEKKSRFIANVYKIESYDEALRYIEETKKKYWDARHNCYALSVGDILRFSDDGEPQGTAGKPMLDILTANELTGCLVVVTRYFGGTLLGTGGLIRAYQESTKAGLDNSVIIEKMYGMEYRFELDYAFVGKLQYMASENEYYIVESLYAGNVTFTVIVENKRIKQFEDAMVELTGGKIEFIYRKEAEFGVHKGEIVKI